MKFLIDMNRRLGGFISSAKKVLKLSTGPMWA